MPQVFPALLSVLLGQACNVEQPVSGPVALTSEWTTVEPPEPLRVAGKLEQTLCIQVDTLRDFDDQNGVVLASGQRHVVEGEAIDDEGTGYGLRVSAQRGDNACLYRAADTPAGPDFPAGRTIVKLRLRSVPPLRTGNIRWYSYDH